MGRRAGLGPAAAGVLVVCLLLVAGTAAGDPGTDKARIDGRIDTLRGRAAASDRQVGVLTEQLSAVAGQVRELEEGVRAQQARLSVLEGQLSAARGRLAALDKTIARQTERLERLRGEYRVALSRLERRVRELYMTDGPDALAFVLGTASFADLIDNLDLLNRIGRQDEEIAARVKASRDGVADARRRTRSARAEAFCTTSVYSCIAMPSPMPITTMATVSWVWVEVQVSRVRRNRPAPMTATPVSMIAL